MKVTYIAVGIGLTIGNFICEAIKKTSDYKAAFERSYFQWIALIGVYVAQAIG